MTYQSATVVMPVETKKQVRMIAAEMNTSLTKAALELIKIGLAEYQKTANNPLYADRNSAPMGTA